MEIGVNIAATPITVLRAAPIDQPARTRRSETYPPNIAARKVVEIAEQELSKHPENPRPAYLGAGSLIELGERDRAREGIARAMATDPDDVLTQYNVACVYSKLGDLEVAFDLLERLLPHANHETKSWVRYDPDFDALRTQRRYARVLELLE